MGNINKARGALLGTLFERLLGMTGVCDPDDLPVGYDGVDHFLEMSRINGREIRDWLLEQAQDFGLSIHEMDLTVGQAKGLGIPEGLWSPARQQDVTKLTEEALVDHFGRCDHGVRHGEPCAECPGNLSGFQLRSGLRVTADG